MHAHFWDETVFLQHARILVDGRTNYDEFYHRPPLLPLLYAAGFLVWDDSYAANVVQGVAAALGLLFAYAYTRAAFGRLPALAATAVLAFAPFIVARSHELMTDGPALTLMLAAMWAFERPGWRSAALSGVLFSLAVQTRYTSLFLAAYFLAQAWVVQRDVRRIAPWGAAAAAAILPYLAWCYARFGSPFHPFVIARRIVTEWTAPVPAEYYARALGEMVPWSVWILFATGIAFAIGAPRRASSVGPATGESAAAVPSAAVQRVLVLAGWGAAYFLYMLSIPHKEARYLLPLAIPVAAIAGCGLGGLVERLAGRPAAIRYGVLVIGAAIFVQQFAPAFGKLAMPWIEPPPTAAESERGVQATIGVASWLGEASRPDEVIYAAHDFPVLAFYSQRTTISLLPIQQTFEQDWRAFMTRPGYLVLFDPGKIGETHARDPAFKPDRAFVEAHREFQRVRDFPTATVYRYVPGR